MDGNELLQTLHLSEAEHSAFSSSKRQVGFLSPIICPATRFLPIRVANNFHCSAIGTSFFNHNYFWPAVAHALSATLSQQKSTKEDGYYATHASNALAKWTKRRWNLTAHSLRHTLRDRLRAAEVPLEAINQIGGWSSVSSIGSSYGKGYTVDHLRQYMDRIAIK